MDILIAEDENITRAMLTKVLKEDGHRLTVTENGLQAWERLQIRASGLVITDWMMPQMDGLTLCRKIRNASFERYIYIIMLTAKDDKKDMLTVLNSGADDYIKKPFDPEELMARVRTGIRSIEREESLRRMQQDILNVAANIKMKNAKLEAAMSKLGNGTGERPAEEAIPLPLEKLKAGMVLAEDLLMNDGLLLISKGTQLKEISIRSIRNFGSKGALPSEVLVTMR